jgi:hypothetical protein
MLTEGQKIKIDKDDAPEFITIVNTVIWNMVFQYDIGEVVFVKIKNWFDHKWLNYSGKTVVTSNDLFYDASLENVWRDKITIPPFNPNRVIYSRFFRIKDTGNRKVEKVINKYRISSDNMHNRISDYTSDGLLIWFSSNTKVNQKGSLMIYRSQNDEVQTWYAKIENINGWKISKSKGIELDRLKAMQ